MKKGSKHKPESIQKITKHNARTGKKFVFSKAHKENLSKANKGNVPWIKGKKQTLEHIKKRTKSRIESGGYSNLPSGEEHYRWIEDRTTIIERHRIRQSKEYDLWRKAVFQRDNFTCVWCEEYGVVLNADHIKSFAHYPQLRFAIDNGRTLCVPCHKKTDNYGGKNKRIN